MSRIERVPLANLTPDQLADLYDHVDKLSNLPARLHWDGQRIVLVEPPTA